MECPEGYVAGQVTVHRRDPDGDAVLWACIQP
jgi:hypothetical protein